MSLINYTYISALTSSAYFKNTCKKLKKVVVYIKIGEIRGI